MKIVAENRWIKKADGKRWLQTRYYDDLYVDASGALGFASSKITEWEDIPLCEDDFPDAATND